MVSKQLLSGMISQVGIRRHQEFHEVAMVAAVVAVVLISIWISQKWVISWYLPKKSNVHQFS